MKAIPTEYKGTVFRSKSEAIFARAVDMCRCFSATWQYEPDFLVPGYTPDFKITFFNTVSIFLEYKPTKPTKTYVNRVKDFVDGTGIEFVIFAYSPFKNEPVSYEGWNLTKWQKTLIASFCLTVIENMHKAKEFRFDLEGEE